MNKCTVCGSGDVKRWWPGLGLWKRKVPERKWECEPLEQDALGRMLPKTDIRWCGPWNITRVRCPFCRNWRPARRVPCSTCGAPMPHLDDVAFEDRKADRFPPELYDGRAHLWPELRGARRRR